MSYGWQAKPSASPNRLNSRRFLIAVVGFSNTIEMFGHVVGRVDRI